MEMEAETRKPVRNLPETIHSLLGLKSHLTSAWVKSVCNIVKNVSSEISSPSASKRSRNPQTKQPTVDEEDDSVSTEVQSIKDELSALTARVNGLNVRRRQILNELLDLKGNIRVFCRVRPIRTGEGLGFSRSVVASDSRNVIIRLTDKKSKLYSFDRVFIPDSSQDEVFLEIEPVIKSVIDGYNACIFAYGQTGTGKTFTMEGVPENPGVVPRAIRALFEQAEESNHAFLINFSMLEIYMGNLRDLLVPQAIRPKDPIPPCLLIHTDAKGEIEIENLVSIKVNDFHHALKLYRLGCRNRATASTNSNSTSSRSHCMIRVSVTFYGAAERRRETNKIWLVDLGGSERVLKTRATGRRLDEGKAINLSLSALGDVINALQHKKPHIPYRNSKLTQVLKDSLGQESKTLMLVHISSKEDDLCETICSLNFATRAKNIHLGQDESTEEREKKEGVMTNLQWTMEKIEQERQRVTRDIRNLDEKLEKLTGKPAQEEEEEHVITEEIPSNPENAKNKSERSANRLPSFMKPTVSSTKKSGRDQNVTSDDSAIAMRPRRLARSTRAESVSFPVKKNGFHSVCNSEKSISKSTCVMRSSKTDNATVYSQDMSECDIKVVVSENMGKPRMGTGQTKPCFKTGNIKKNGNRKTGEHEFSRVDNWLQSQTENRSYIHSKKQVTATPFPEKLRRLNTNKMSREASTNKFAQEKIIGHETAEKTEGIEESETVETVTKPMVMLKDLFELPCSCSSEPDDQILDDDDYDDEDGESLYPPIAGYEGLSQCTDDEEEHILREEFSDRFNAEHGANQFSSLQEDDYNADWERDSSASISMLERDSDLFKQFSTELDLEVQLVRPKSQRALLLTDHIVMREEDAIPPLLRSQESLGEKEKTQTFVEKAKALWFTALMGLGFMDMGYGNDFFYGLTK